MDEQHWLRRCADRFMQRAGMSDEDAMGCARACFENLGNDLTENPEDAADDDLTYWAN